ncbi:hypothetical protein EV714DRAFT_178472, partial [Schizophyllum commune]
YEAELVGKLLGLHLLAREGTNFHHRQRTIILDNTSALNAAKTRYAHSGQYLVENIVETIDELKGPSPKLTARWAKSHVGIAGNERVDEEAKKAAQGESSPRRALPPLLRSG